MSPVLVDNFRLVVNKIQTNGKPYYMHGHRVEITKRLLAKRNLADKYPLVALRQDFPEVVKGGLVHYKLNILIVAHTKQEHNAEQRYEAGKAFKATLYPIYNDLLDAIGKVGKFGWNKDPKTGSSIPPHIKIDRPYWGVTTKEGNEKNIFSDPLDAIEIIDLEIYTKLKNC